MQIWKDSYLFLLMLGSKMSLVWWHWSCALGETECHFWKRISLTGWPLSKCWCLMRIASCRLRVSHNIWLVIFWLWACSPRSPSTFVPPHLIHLIVWKNSAKCFYTVLCIFWKLRNPGKIIRQEITISKNLSENGNLCCQFADCGQNDSFSEWWEYEFNS